MTYSIYIEFTNDTYKVIKRKCQSEKEAERLALEYANEKDLEISWIEALPV